MMRIRMFTPVSLEKQDSLNALKFFKYLSTYGFSKQIE